MNPAPNATKRTVEITLDGRPVEVPEGSTLLQACRQEGIDTPTLCFLENLTPVNVCRICVVEVEGSRTLVPACSRAAEAGMKVQTDSERVRLSPPHGDGVPGLVGGPLHRPGGAGLRRALRGAAGALRAHGATGEGRRARRARTRVTTSPPAPAAPRSTSPSRSTTTSTCATTRSASSATSAWRPAAPTPRTPSPSRWPGAASMPASPPSSRLRCPTPPASTAATASASAPRARSCSRASTTCAQAGRWDERKQTQTDTVCGYCGVGCNLTLHVQDNRIVKVTSPLDHDVTHGHLCIKGRFGWAFVQDREEPRG